MADKSLPKSQYNPLQTISPELEQLIIDQLELPAFLFVPAYRQEDAEIPCGEPSLNSQHKKYYGADRNVHQSPGALALLNLSCTCSYYRKLLKPRLFRDVLLRTTSKSLTSVEAICKTSSWEGVRSLTVCTVVTPATEDKADEEDEKQPENDKEETEDDEDKHDGDNEDESVDADGSGSTQGSVLEDAPKFDLARLSALLENLPPSLDTLVLDFPWHWYECQDDCMELAATGDLRIFLEVIFRSVSRNDFSSRPSFTLKLYNLPNGGWTSSLRNDPNSANFFCSVTTFFFSIHSWDNGAGWKLNTVSDIEDFTTEIGPTFIEPLSRIQSLELQANSSCPIGFNEIRDLPFPRLYPGLQLLNLRKLSLSYFFIGDRLTINFLTNVLPNLEHLTLLNCGCFLTEDDDEHAFGTWAKIFERLETGAQQLKSLGLQHYRGERRLLKQYGDMPEVDEEYGELFKNELEYSEEAQKWLPRRRVLPYMYTDDKYGMYFADEDENKERFDAGDDHRALLKLENAIKARGGGGVYYPPLLEEDDEDE